MKKLKTIVNYGTGILAILLFGWLFISWLDAYNHNSEKGHDYSKWNAFVILTAEYEQPVKQVMRESPELAEYECMKGIIQQDEQMYELQSTQHSLYTEENLELLAHLINAEAGSNWCSDEMEFYVGSVVLNRVSDDRFPNTIRDVIFQPGQYACVDNGSFWLEPSERCWEIANDLLNMGSVLPSKVVWQAQFHQGSAVYIKEQNMYFCY